MRFTKKVFSQLALLAIAFLIAFLAPTKPAYADFATGKEAASIEGTDFSRTNGELVRTIHVKLNPEALTLYHSVGVQVELAYTQVTDPSINQDYLTTHALGIINGVFVYRKECTHDTSAKDDPNFTCTTLKIGNYGTFADEIFIQQPLTRDSWPLTNIEYFNVMDVPYGKSGPDITNLVVTPTTEGATISGDFNQAALDELKKEGQWNDLKFFYSEVEKTTSQAGTYAKIVNWQSKIPDQAGLDSTNNPQSFKVSLTGLKPNGSYIFALEYGPGNTNDYIFFTSYKDLLIPSDVAASTTPAGFGPNAYGCSTDGQNNTYCMLAPLPIVDAQGKIDPTGKLNVSTGVGDYLKGMIKLIMGLIMVFAVFMVVVGGIEYMSSVQVGEKEGAKTRIIGALGGVVLALSSYLILNTINPNLVNITVSAPQAVIKMDDDYTPTADIGQPLPPETAGSGSAPTGTTDVKSNNTDYNSVLAAAATKHNVSCTFLKAIMYRESNGNPTATSSVGAYGLMQMMPATWRGLGYTDQSQWSNPSVAADAAAKYVETLKTTACNNAPASNICDASSLKNLAAAYNGGPKANKASASCPGTTLWECYVNWTPRPGSYRQTKRYVDTVLNNYNKLTSEGWGC
ncbi:MAG: lytic transglycosylase domain-containing protein [bacterium]